MMNLTEKQRQVIETIKFNGPDRVVCEVSEGYVHYAGPAWDAERRGKVATSCFIRNDGWALGFEECDRDAAYDTWDDCWAFEFNMMTGAITEALPKALNC